MKRGFEIVSKYESQGIHLPIRATQNAAGYDFYAAQDFIIPSIWRLNFIKLLWKMATAKEVLEDEQFAAQKDLKPFLVPTGIKAYMQPDEFLLLANRSSNPLKRSLILPNGVGIVDADYYNNADNEGEIFFQLLNFGVKELRIKKGERIGQGIFVPFLLADAEQKIVRKRTGGFGSSGR
ncbi:dUTP diphosphatase [Liquorilactobacillus satsumensis]|uniref:dUTP diphosphatase n=1 Tax=Liquorilactobacillus satsumensis DSM 16230 = JCM 12392 TaxID=1423801 RepID=A0A0R1V3S1_9LACO|nr:dUTP diphosphatase [Liquorilactobacillus satsumensis]KRM00256.1 deoxyuridine 5-triphosphate nucleotidohydrolase [Liquorilactobacillus satsumensis DSM 16230 = JCM 12392]MCC7665817.1 dUTP diphosphatase [Liquorilactobacillus satsumensis]MCP9313338.1 dUTP diphosphatase [Liquorilactobacillus satsumensis]MCP9328169.1 dUTP diphosphatase [Liquorilactobacillus satsumensis]MCP9356388.1 dUTP diphosphatase [Liquorilactobacillus satsumensis]